MTDPERYNTKVLRMPSPNAPGTGIADDKAIYSYMPDIVEFYTGEKAILQNVPTWRCSDPDSLSYVLDHLEELVVRRTEGGLAGLSRRQGGMEGTEVGAEDLGAAQ